MDHKKTLVFGASPNPARIAHQAALKLKERGHPLILLGLSEGFIGGVPIEDPIKRPSFPDIHTITVYVNPDDQKAWEDYLLSLNPKRIIFNPGAENASLQSKAKNRGVETHYACTLVLLSTGAY